MAGIPNITGHWAVDGLDVTTRGGGWGCTRFGWLGGNGYAGHGRKDGNVPFLDFAASGSSSIYGSSDTVTPISISCKFVICY